MQEAGLTLSAIVDTSRYQMITFGSSTHSEIKIRTNNVIVYLNQSHTCSIETIAVFRIPGIIQKHLKFQTITIYWSTNKFLRKNNRTSNDVLWFRFEIFLSLVV